MKLIAVIQELQPIDTSPVINKFVEFGIVGVMLLLIIVAMYLQDKSHKQERKEWIKRLEKVIDTHQEDLKENGRDRTAMLEKYHAFTEAIKEIVKPSKNG